MNRWSSAFAFLFLLAGCSTDPGTSGTSDADTSDTGGADVTDTGSPTDVTDVTPPRDVVDVTQPTDVADVMQPTDVTDATPSDVTDASMGKDVTDASAPSDVTDATPSDVTDASMGMDVTDASMDAATDTAADAAPLSVGCARSLGTLTLPGTNANVRGTTRGTSTQPSTGCRPSASGPEDVYTLNVTARTGVILSTANMGTSFDTLLSVRRTCTDAMTEVTCDDDGSPTSTGSIARAVLDPGMYSVLVEGYSGATGSYELSTSTFTPAANAVCSGAAVLAPGAMLAGQDLATSGAPSLLCDRLTDSGALYYSVTVPASSRVNVSVTPVVPDGGTTFTPSIRVLDSCSSTTCVTSTSSATSVPLVNSGTSPRTFTVIVARTFWDAVGTYSIAASAAMSVVRGTDCGLPITVTPGTDLTGQDTAIGTTPSSACVTSSNGNQLFYEVTVPAGQYARVSATSTGTTARSPVLRVVESCTATVCQDYHTGTTTTDGVAYITNTGTTPRTAVFSLSTTGGATVNGTFTVRAALNPVGPMGAACESPIALTSGSMLNGTLTSSGYRPNRTCSGTELGPQIFYTVTTPARTRSRVVVTPAMGAAWTARLRVLADCNATACTSNTAGASSGAAVETTIVNDTDMPRTSLVSVAATSATATVGAYTILSTNSAIPAYTRTMITGACDDLTMGSTAVAPAAGWSDDSASPAAALPFAFNFFGDAVTHYTVTSNGFMQVWNTATPTASTSASESMIPSTGTPNNYIAPFWDDLLPVSGRSGVRVATLGSMPSRRFVVEWYGWETYPTTTSNLRFQAKLFEGSNQIELHYCSLEGTNARVRGSSAGAGIEDATGSFGSQASYDTADSITTTNAHRFAPR